MKKLLILLICLIPINTFALTLPEVTSSAVVVYDLNEDKLLFDTAGDEVKSIASLTKMATVLTAVELNQDYDHMIKITDQMLYQVNPELSVYGLKSGDEYSYDALLHMCMLRSSADACIAIAFDLAGSEQSMTNQMNIKMQSLGLKNTFFENVTGMDAPNHRSTAKDMMELVKYSLKNEKWRSIYTCKKYVIDEENTIRPTINAIAKGLELDLSKIKGDKTGYTTPAGLCMASLIEIEDHEMILVTLGAPPVLSEGYHARDQHAIINYLEDNYNYEVLYASDEILKNIPIELSKTEEYKVKLKKDVKKFLPSDYDKSLLSYIYDGKELLSYLDEKGNKIGELTFYYDGKEIYKESVILDEDIEASIPKIMYRYKFELSIMLILLIIVIILFIILFKLNSKKKVVKKK